MKCKFTIFKQMFKERSDCKLNELGPKESNSKRIHCWENWPGMSNQSGCQSCLRSMVSKHKL